MDSKPHNRFRARFLLAVFVALLVCAGSALAQKNPASPTKPAESSPVVTSKTRVRRVAEASVEKSDAPTATAQPQSADTETVPAPADAPDDPVRALRDQIAAAANPNERAQLRFKLVDQLVAAGMKKEAVAELHSMAGEDRFDPVGFYNIGNALARLDDAAGAIDAYRKAIDQRRGNYSRALNNLGVVLLRQERWDEAQAVFLSALKQERFRYAEASYNLGRLYAARGETNLAIREWRRALAVDPHHRGAAEALGNQRSDGIIEESGRAAGRSAGATSPPVRAATSTTGTPNVDSTTYDLLQRARNARERGRNEDAVQDYRLVLSRRGGYFPPANLELGYALISLKRNDEAIASILPVSKNDGARYPIAYYHLGRLYEQNGDLKLAEENYNQAAAAYSDNSQYLLDVSRVREGLGDLTGALAALEQYVQANERVGRKPAWSDERLEQLRQKIAASAAGPAKP